jgi:hypothetical protein
MERTIYAGTTTGKHYCSGCCLTTSDILIMASENTFPWDDDEIRISIRPSDLSNMTDFTSAEMLK